MQPWVRARNFSFTIRSSSEWKEIAAARPPGASTAGSASSHAARAPSSSFTAMRSAWKVRVAGGSCAARPCAGSRPRRPRRARRCRAARRASTAALHRARDGPREGLLAVLAQDARELALVDPAEQVAQRLALVAHPHVERARAREGEAARRPRRAAGDETPRSTSAPSTAARPSAASTFFASRKSARTARNASPKRASRALAAASARGSLSMPITLAPRSRRRREWPPPPSVPSSRSLPGSGRSASTISARQHRLMDELAHAFPKRSTRSSGGTSAAICSAYVALSKRWMIGPIPTHTTSFWSPA